MSEPGQVATATPLPMPILRVDRPADVQVAVAAALRTCHAWQPVVVRPPPRSDGQHASLQAPQRVTVESHICDLIDNWPANLQTHEVLVLSMGVILTLTCLVILLLLTHFLRVLGDTPVGIWLSTRLDEPLRITGIAAVGVVVGSAGCGLLTDILGKAGLHSPTLAWGLCVFGGLAGGCALVWQRSRAQRRVVVIGIRRAVRTDAP